MTDTKTQTIVTAGRIAEAYGDLAKYPGQFVKIREMREQLSDIPRAELDAVLAGLYCSQVINLVSQANQQALTAADRAAAVRVGGDDKHRMTWNDRD